MKNVTQELKAILAAFEKKMDAISDEDFLAKPHRDKWSKQEVLGHLIDSAQNNLRRFICSQYEVNAPLITYQQDFWVVANAYQQAPREDLMALWRLLNLRICTVLENMPAENYSKISNTGSLRTLEWLAEDYVKHMKHHLNQIIAASFDVIYP